jgi:hypothetical protein
MAASARNAAMDPVIESAKAELANIEKQFQTLNKRREKLVQLLSLYNEIAANNTATDGHVRIVVPAAPSATKKVTAKDRILDAVYTLLSDGRPRHTRVILNHLDALGVDVGGKDRVLALSALLSRDEDRGFVPSRTVGWSLKKANPESVAADPGLFNPGA